MRMNEKVSSMVSYVWNTLCGFLAGFLGLLGMISPDWWMVIISFIGMIITAGINYHFQKKRYDKEFGYEQD
ncbi:hypothetical protein C1M56_00940 [Vibrio diazotrophicus]|nr:hypothetical protein C1M56_00940 [Vibrio diazotrophicus]